ncbi:MAG: ATP-binding protein [Deltaproteobacteria bacterium]|nr:ATP-binding protein [Deltaproteobacteria bacterium]MDH3963966.1 ATP-binding protein [Deltaproteobacteria bacterium]
MYLSKILRSPRTLAFRLTLWYAFIFTLTSLGAFLLFNFLITSGLRERTDQALLAEVSELSSHLALKGLDVVELDIVQDAESSGVDRMFLRVLSLDGEELVSSNMTSWTNVAIKKAALDRLTNGESHVFETLAIPQLPHKVRILYGVIGPGKLVQIGRSLEDDELFMEAFRDRFVLMMTALIIFGGLIGWFMARRALQGVEEVAQTAEDISKGAIERRVPFKARGAEIDRLATTFNDMLDRIHALICGMREISDNIAHDLRSPLTRIRGVAEMTLTSGKSVGEYESMAANTIEECDRLLEMIETMLAISELEAGAGNLAVEEVDMAEVVEDACELFQPLAEDKSITIVTEVATSSLVNGDTQRLQRLVANLLDNAIKYTESEGTIKVSLDGDASQVLLFVEDTGDGISGDDLANIFERFYRCDPSRSKTGVGLGLSLVMAIARSHGGEVAVTSYPGKGSTFTVSLPR